MLIGSARQERQDMAEWGCAWNGPEMQARNSSFVLVRAAIGLVRQAWRARQGSDRLCSAGVAMFFVTLHYAVLQA